MDGVLFHDQQYAGVEIIIRNSQRQVIMAAIKKENAVAEPSEIELLAILRGLQL